jgi:hypothetical protein
MNQLVVDGVPVPEGLAICVVTDQQARPMPNNIIKKGG